MDIELETIPELETTIEVKFTVKCTVQKLDKTAAAHDLSACKNMDDLYADPRTWIYLEKEQQLFNLLMNDSNSIKRIFYAEAARAVFDASSELENKRETIDDVLLDLYKKLPNKSDVHYFDKAVQDEMFSEHVEHIYNRFNPTIEDISIHKVENVGIED